MQSQRNAVMLDQVNARNKKVTNFVETTMSYVILGNDRICRFFDKKRPKRFYDAKLIFWSFATFFALTIFDQVPNKGSTLVKFIILLTRVGYLIC